ncbi:GntR family transcriptional regulator [Ferrimonas sp. YFM]|uniref:GntR family transcriptional regulator n=1 Tax=Ferrimonas sp. YFM TaxID=3028878 RepID=UPI002572293F|nr:GntR family transcriptional regulator [Ferrimonas sp. YFM]BDY06944.1 methycitrate-responsive transcriptional regulator of methylisocitrate utilization PrpR [Ferrimonas sp. YFM]
MAESQRQLTLADQLAHKLQVAIVQGEISAGSKINEQELAARYGVSRGPLREALQKLERRRLVVKAPHIGARVAQLTPEELGDLYQVRAELEAMACRLAASRISASQLAQLQLLLKRQEKVFTDQSGDYALFDDIDFHLGIIHASGNQTLIHTLTDDLYHLLQMYRNQCSSGRRPMEALAQHRRILDAIADGDGELAALLMRRHIESGRANTERVLRNQMEEISG